MRPTYSLSTKRRNFSLSRKLDRWKLFSLQPSSAIKKNSVHSDARTTKPAMRKGCDHVSSPFWFDKQSHVTEGVNIRRQNQLSGMSLNSQSTCFGSTMWALCLSSPSATLWLSSLAVLDHVNDNPGKGLLMSEVVRPLCILLDNQTLKNVTTWVHLFGLTTKPRASNR